MTGLKDSTLFRAYWKRVGNISVARGLLGEAPDRYYRQAHIFREKLTEKLEVQEKELDELRKLMI